MNRNSSNGSLDTIFLNATYQRGLGYLRQLAILF